VVPGGKHFAANALNEMPSRSAWIRPITVAGSTHVGSPSSSHSGERAPKNTPSLAAFSRVIEVKKARPRSSVPSTIRRRTGRMRANSTSA
jgi:hypothetical protein